MLHGELGEAPDAGWARVVQWSPEDTMTAVKEAARVLVEQLPENATWDDLLYAVEFRLAVERGRAEAREGRSVSNDEVRASYGLKG